MDHFRLRKYRGREIWAKVRAAYVAGEPGPQLAQRFDVGLANLRKKAMREGWTRRAASRDSDPLILATQPDLLGGPVADRAGAEDAAMPLGRAIATAVQRAASLVTAGRAAEATALLKAAEALSRHADAEPHPEPAPVLTDAQDIDREAGFRTAWELLDLTIQERASALAADLIGDTGSGAANHMAFLLRWRAEMLGPAIAEADREREYDRRTRPPTRDANGGLRPAREYADCLYGYLRGGMRVRLGLPARAPDQRVESP